MPAHKNRKEDKICKPLFCYNPQFDTHIDDQFMPLTDDSLITKAKIAFMAKTLGNATFHCPCWDSLRMGYSTAVHNVSHVVVCFPWTTWISSRTAQSGGSFPTHFHWAVRDTSMQHTYTFLIPSPQSDPLLVRAHRKHRPASEPLHYPVPLPQHIGHICYSSFPSTLALCVTLLWRPSLAI